jgi:non-ribosomal peptide synthetase-like protein
MVASGLLAFVAIAFAAWRRYLWVVRKPPKALVDTSPYSLTDHFGEQHLLNAPHQKDARWLTDIFSRSAKRFPHHTALQIPATGESLSYAELDARAEAIACALSPLVTGPDQIVAVVMTQDNWQIVASHLGILKAGGVVMYLDTSLPEAMVTQMIQDARPVAVLTRGQNEFRDLPTVDVLALPDTATRRQPPTWLDDPERRLATVFYTSGTTGLPKGVECPHAGYVNLALSYADYFDLVPSMDATSLTSSMGYDGSISEMYSAWVSGCSVVLVTGEQLRSGPDLIPVLREAEVTVLFCPPVLLTTLTSQPEHDLPYPLCRYIVPAGEAFPAALVEPWTRNRRQVINTYGPTEASTDTSRQSLRPGEAVTIGSPFPNVSYVVLEVGGLRPLPHGEPGELCIGGIHVARGYRNQPELTARQFITHPDFGRLYRTGDRCRIDIHTHRVHFLGRVDAQLKVRGHRVEIQPVEDLLQTGFEEIETAVLDYQNEELVAFVCAPSLRDGRISGTERAPAEWAMQVTQRLGESLPPPAVPTRIFLVEAFEMKPLSGKIDRARLPQLSELADFAQGTNPADSGTPGASDLASPSTPTGEVLAICRELLGPTLGWDDAFADHGGHSIVIAQLVQRLQAAGWPVTVRDLLSDCDTARKVADGQREQQAAAIDEFGRPAHEHPQTERDEKAATVYSTARFTALQFLFLLLLYAPGLLGLVAIVAAAEIGEFFVTATWWQFALTGVLVYLSALALPFAGLFWVMTIKRFMKGHVKRSGVRPGVYPKWSRMHLRVWCIRRLEQLVLRPLATLLRSAPLLAWVLRRLGATVGRNLQCAPDAELSGPLDLLLIEDDVAIQTGACISVLRWVGDELHIGPVRLGSGCKIGMRSGVANGVDIGQGSWITPLTPILENTGPNEIWEGAPARCTGRHTGLRRSATQCRSRLPGWFAESLNLLMQMMLEICLLILPTAMVAWLATTLLPVEESGRGPEYFSLTPLPEVIWNIGMYAFLTSWVTIVLVSLLVCLFVRLTPASPGLYPVRGLTSALLLYRMKKLNQVQRLWTWTVTGQYLRAVAGLRFTRVGGSECDLMHNLVPEAVSADAQVFWSHGCYTNVLDYGARHIRFRLLDMPANFFASNNCVAEAGQLPDNFLLGVSTPASDIRFRRQMRSRPGQPITVAGNPPLRFASADFESEHEAAKPPGFGLFLGRVALGDLFSIGLLPVAEVVAYAMLYTVLLRLGGHPVVTALLALVLSEAALVGLCILVKQLLIGRRWGSDHSAPFWSWRHFSYFFSQDCYFAWCKRPLTFLAGTVLTNPLLRRMGCGIGKRTLLSVPLQAFDWNAVHFGDDCVIEGLLQLHTLENMRLKVKRCEIGNGSSINFGATVMGGVVIQPGSTVLPLGLVLKEMRLPTGIYQGSPVEPEVPR